MMDISEREYHQTVIDWIDEWIVTRPGTVVLAFLVVTAVFAVGLGGVSTQSGTDQFTSGSPAGNAYEDVQREFSPPFETGSGSTTLIQSGSNVLSKPALLRMLRAQEAISERDDLRVAGTSSAARIVAQQLDPQATTLEAQIRAVERATPSEIDAAVRRAAGSEAFTGTLSSDFNPEAASAGATIAGVQHNLGGSGGTMGAGTSGSSPLQTIQVRMKHVLTATGHSDIRVFGSGIISSEFSNVIFDSLILVVPAAVLLILAFLVYAYRDPVDLLLGIVSLTMAIIWTFGFMGLAGVPFTQMLIAIPPLLLAVGIDFGIHAINRYREERAQGIAIVPAMRTATDQLLVAFFIVTATTVIGFGANTTSSLGPIRDFGVVAAIGIVFTFLIFGVFLPAGKVYSDRKREAYGIPILGERPIGDEGSLLGSVLNGGNVVARRAPYVMLAVLVVVTASAGYYGAGVDTSFSQEDFLPPEHVPAYLQSLPEPFAPGQYSATATLNFLEDHFDAAQTSQVTIYIEGDLRRDTALEEIHRAGAHPPDSFVTTNQRANGQSVIDVIQAYAAQDPQFRALVERNDANDNGVPDDNLDEIYAQLLDSPYGSQAERYISDDFRSARVVYSAKSDASQAEVTSDAQSFATQFRFHAVATGQTVVFQSISDTIFESAVQSLAIALLATALFLLLVYWLLEGRPTLGLVNLAPIVVSLALIPASMRYLGVPFNALTATILSIAIGMGIDYSAHVVHRFGDEYDGTNVYEALERTMYGTGGALTGSMLTTTTGIGVLVIAITPILGQFGLVTALAIFYSYLTAIFVTPTVAVVWHRLRTRNRTAAPADRLGQPETDAE